jgi:hypothetical protein
MPLSVALVDNRVRRANFNTGRTAMEKQNTKDWIRELAEEYFRETQPDHLQEMDETWQVFEELKLLDQGGIQLQESDTLPTVGVSGDLVATVATAIALGVISNAVYDTLKWSAKQVIKAINDKGWQEKFISRMGELSSPDRGKALATLQWTLDRIHRRKKSQ